MPLTNVRVPAHLAPIFEQAEKFVERYFAEQRSVPEQGTLEVCGERYVLVRAASLSVEFFETFRKFYGTDPETQSVVRALLFDVAHAMALADAESFTRRMGLSDPIARLSAGPLHFARAGWAFVDISEESSPLPGDDFYLLFDHPYSFESNAWLNAGKRTECPVCTMNAGYASGWCENSFGVPLVAVEILCRAMGDATCRFIMATPSRIEARISAYAERNPALASSIARCEVPAFLSQRTDRQLLRRNRELEHDAVERARELATANEHLKRDIEVRERTQAALSASIELNDRLLEALPGGVVHVTAGGAVVRANADACRILGLTSDEMLERWITEFDTLSEDGMKVPVEDYPVARAIATGQVQPPMTLGVRNPDGKITWAVYRAVPTRDPATQVVNGAIVTFYDITERKRFEEKLRHAQKLDSLGVLAGGLAHDFNNLLVSILGNASYGKSLPDTARGELAEIFADIETGARRAAELTKQMLDYAGQSRVSIESVELVTVVQEMMKLLKALVPKHVQVRYQFPEGLPSIQADATQVRQVVMNLITNAAEAMQGEGEERRLLISLELRRVGAEALERYLAEGAEPGTYVSLEVTDTGVGMSQETVSRVFDPFFTTKFKGRGLGMAAVLGIVRSHHGAIAIDSTEGQGTKVTVLWPVRRREESAPRRAAATQGSVLVVDDDAGVRALLRRAMNARGYDVLLASDATEGLRLFEQHEGVLSLVVMDVTMPGMSGFDAVRAMRLRGSRVPVLLSSGYEVDEYEAARLGVGAVLPKPYDLTTLLEAVDAALSGGGVAKEGDAG